MIKMKKPDLDRMWETFIKIEELDLITPNKPFIDHSKVIRIIRGKIYPMISRLQNERIIDWYSFLIHNRKSGVPTTEDDPNVYFHVRVSLKNEGEPSFPDYCVMTRKIKREWVESIAGIDKSLLKTEEIEEAWRIIGEQSEWFLNMLNIHKEDLDIPTRQVRQFLHFYANMSQLQVL